MQQEAEEAGRTIAELRQRKLLATDRLAAPTAKPPAIELTDTARTINDKRALVQEQLDRPLCQDACEKSEGLLDELEELVVEAGKELADLGGDAPALILAFGTLEAADEIFGDRGALRKACKDFKSPKALAELAIRLGGNLKTGAGTLKTLGTAMEADEIIAAEAALGAGTLTDLLGAAGNDAGQLKVARGTLGDAGLKELAATPGGAATPFTLITELGGAAETRKLLDETGLGGKPKALAALLTKGCGGNAKQLAATAAAFPSPQERKGLKDVLEEGGLGDAPDALGELLANGCGGRPAGLKAFTTSFASPESRQGLARLLDAGGLKGKTSDLDQSVQIDPKCLSALLRFGAGKTKDQDPADDASRGDALAELCRQFQQEDCERLSTVLVDGGLGTEPDVFGHMVGLGCAADPGKLKTLSTTLATAPPNPPNVRPPAWPATAWPPATWPPLTAMKAFLRSGGFGTKDANDQATNTDPKCLGTMLGTGCEGKADDLVTLTCSLADQNRAELALVLRDGGLGTRPNVLGNTYKFGCLGDPYDPTSTKDPTHLKTFAATFGDTPPQPQPPLPPVPGNAPKLKRMLEHGGLGQDTDAPPLHQSEWLGKVIRDGFTERNYVPAVPPPAPPPVRAAPPIPSGKAQDPNQLLALHDAFYSGNTSHMPKLKNMIEAMGTMPPSCGSRDEPGKALQNVLNPNGALGGVAVGNLRTQFYATLNTRAGGNNAAHVTTMGNGGPTNGVHNPAASLSGPRLIQMAASMEWEPIVEPAYMLTAGNGVQYEADMLHYMRRHSRSADQRDLPNGNNNTSFLPKSVTEEELRDIVRQSVDNCTFARANPYQNPNPHRNHPPQVIYDLTNYQRQYTGYPEAATRARSGLNGATPMSTSGSTTQPAARMSTRSTSGI